MPDVTSVNEELSIVNADPQGIIVQYVYPGPDVMDVFAVSLSFDSVKSLEEGMKRNHMDWTIEDGSLNVSGNRDGIRMTFMTQYPPYGDVSVALNSKDSWRFTSEILNIAEGGS
jgi:hypothetical protein